jgi:hypothetical protein
VELNADARGSSFAPAALDDMKLRMATEVPVAKRVLAALICGSIFAACFSGVKYARDGEPCASGDQLFEAEVSCADGLRCLPFNRYASGRRSGSCAPSCESQAGCAADRVCAGGACVPACSPACGASFEYSGVCCRFPSEGVSACLPAAACDEARGARDAGSDDGPAAGEVGG